MSEAKELRTVLPRTDIIEESEKIALYLDLPGVEQSSADVSIDKGVLTISAPYTRKLQRGNGALHREFGECVYKRSFKLSEAFDLDKIEAKLADGVLSVILPKAQAAKERKITVQLGE